MHRAFGETGSYSYSYANQHKLHSESIHMDLHTQAVDLSYNWREEE